MVPDQLAKNATMMRLENLALYGIYGIVKPGMPVHHTCSLNMHCEGVIGPRNFKHGGDIEKSYGFSFVGPVSMEMLLTFESEVFVKITTILTSPASIIIS